MVVFVTWLAVLGWGLYEVAMIRSSRVGNALALPGSTVIGVLTIVVFTWSAPASSHPSRFEARLPLTLLFVGAAVVGTLLWARQDPLPELRSVPLPPANASPAAVVRSFVEALNYHDRRTASALCFDNDPPCQFLDYYVHVRITRLRGDGPTNNHASLTRGVTGFDVGVNLVGTTRDGGPVGEDGYWGYILAPLGPHRAWRIIDEGTG